MSMRNRRAFTPIPTSLTRRQVLAGTAGLAAAASWPVRLVAATSPHILKVGDFEVIVVDDGTVTPPPPFISSSNAPPEAFAAALKAASFEPGKSNLAANATVIRSGSDLILVDTGSGPNLQPSAGKLVENLTGAGIDPATVTKVVFSHGHPDHIWGTIGDGDALRFPNAAYYIAGAEWDFWTAPETVGMFPKDFQVFVTEAQRNLTRVKDVVTMIKPGDDIVTGVRVLDTAGHTPGHISLEVDGGEGLIIVADAVIFPSISFEHPEWQVAMDGISDLAAANRAKLLDRVATDKIRMIGFHWPYPGVGFAERKDSAYRFAPAA
jgi:glyoxylase-like metal-dependent hydrolase (beta-lactamase superfamily II)